MVPARGLLDGTATMRDAVVALAEQRGLAIVVDAHTVLGVLTAGDLSRVAEREPNFLDLPVRDLMTTSPHLARAGDLAAATVGRMEDRGIMAMPVLDETESLVGVVHLHDLLRAGAA